MALGLQVLAWQQAGSLLKMLQALLLSQFWRPLLALRLAFYHRESQSHTSRYPLTQSQVPSIAWRRSQPRMLGIWSAHHQTFFALRHRRVRTWRIYKHRSAWCTLRKQLIMMLILADAAL
jgi:hypothetical protein